MLDNLENKITEHLKAWGWIFKIWSRPLIFTRIADRKLFEKLLGKKWKCKWAIFYKGMSGISLLCNRQRGWTWNVRKSNKILTFHFIFRDYEGVCAQLSLKNSILKIILYKYIEILLISKQKYLSETYSNPCQVSKIEILKKIVNGFKLLTIVAKTSILGVW